MGRSLAKSHPDIVHVGEQRVEWSQLLAQAPSAFEKMFRLPGPIRTNGETFAGKFHQSLTECRKRLVAKDSSAFNALLEKILLLGDPVSMSIEE